MQRFSFSQTFPNFVWFLPCFDPDLDFCNLLWLNLLEKQIVHDFCLNLIERTVEIIAIFKAVIKHHKFFLISHGPSAYPLYQRFPKCGREAKSVPQTKFYWPSDFLLSWRTSHHMVLLTASLIILHDYVINKHFSERQGCIKVPGLDRGVVTQLKPLLNAARWTFHCTDHHLCPSTPYPLQYVSHCHKFGHPCSICCRCQTTALLNRLQIQHTARG